MGGGGKGKFLNLKISSTSPFPLPTDSLLNAFERLYSFPDRVMGCLGVTQAHQKMAFGRDHLVGDELKTYFH